MTLITWKLVGGGCPFCASILVCFVLLHLFGDFVRLMIPVILLSPWMRRNFTPSVPLVDF